MAFLGLNTSDLFAGREPLIDSWPLMATPWPMLAITALYLHFSLKSGPKFMANREPFKIKYWIIVYNAIQIYICFWLFTRIFYVENFFAEIFRLDCTPIQIKEEKLLKDVWMYGWWYFILKIADLLDTVFFVLRKKQNHISFLHLYHHSSMIVYTWMLVKYAPLERLFMIGVLNTFVHFVMYFYYLLAALGPQVQPYLWWKKYLTRLQLAQFLLVGSYMGIGVALNCYKLDRGLVLFFVTNSIVLTYLFGDFYRKTYVKKKSQ